MNNENNNPSEPDIIITEEDLDKINDFFNRSEPKPLNPTALVGVKCTKSGHGFYILFEQITDKSWKLCGSIDESTLPAKADNNLLQTPVQSDLVSGSIDWSGFICPHCSALSVAKCHKCGRLSCHPDGKQGNPFQCGWCGSKGTLGGYIKSLDGSESKKK